MSTASTRFCVLLLAALACGPALAAEFTVNPIRLELGQDARSGVIAVRNDGAGKISFQVDARQWVQNARGEDEYLDTQDLVFFPKIMTVEPGEERVIRIGARQPVVAVEKTYRLFIEQLPDTAPAREGAEKSRAVAQVNILYRLAAPIFVAPVKPSVQAHVQDLALANARLAFAVDNDGNEHFLVEGVKVTGRDGSGREAFSTVLPDRYFLAGVTKKFSAEIPPEACGQLRSLTIELIADRPKLTQTLDVSPGMCR